MTIASVVIMSSTLSKKSAEHLSLRVQAALSEPAAKGDYTSLNRASDIIFLNPAVLSFQVYRKMDDGDRKLFFARHTSSTPSFKELGHTRSLISNAIRPAFYHERFIPILSEGEDIGTITISILDHERIHASATLVLVLMGLFSFILASFAGVAYWRHKRHTELLHILYKEIISSRDHASSHQLDKLRYHPLLSRTLWLVRENKRKSRENENALRAVQEELRITQATLNKIQLDATNLKREQPDDLWKGMVAHAINLIQELAQRSRDPKEKDIIDLIYQTLWHGTKGREVSFPPHGETSGFEVACLLHQISCNTRHPSVIFMPDISFEQKYQGSALSIAKASLLLLDVATEYSLSDSTLYLRLSEDPDSHKIVLICTLTSPTSRENTQFAHYLAKRKSFLSLQDKIERVNGILKIDSEKNNAIHLVLTLPLLPTRKMRLSQQSFDKTPGSPVYLIHSSPKGEALCYFYQKAALPILSVSLEQITVLEPGIIVVINEDKSVYQKAIELIAKTEHKVITITSNSDYPHQDEGRSLMVIDMKASPLHHMEQINLLRKERLPVSLTGGPLPPLKTQNILTHLIKRMAPSPEYESTLWIPCELTYLSEENILTDFSHHGIKIETYDLESLPGILPLDGHDSILVMANALKDLAIAEVIKETLGVIVLLDQETSVPDLSHLTNIRKIISQPIDTGYLISIVLGSRVMP